MKILELFAGSRSIGKVADKYGHQVFSVDVKAFDKIDLVKDIEFLTIHDLPFVPDMVWASPPCTTFSIAAISHHRDMGIPRTVFAEKSDNLVKSVLNLIYQIDHERSKYSPVLYYIENPRGYLRKMKYMRGLPRTTVTYCSYGDTRMKPTDIWSNNIRNIFNPNGWQPKPICFNGNTKCHHEAAPRGSRTGTQGLKDNHERSKIPEQLCEEIILQTSNEFKQAMLGYGYDKNGQYWVCGNNTTTK